MNSQTSPPPMPSPDEAAVHALYQRLMDAWNTSSGEAYAAPFAEDGDLIGFDGTHFKGRHEIAPFHQRLFDTHLKGTRLVGQVTSVRFLSPDVALMHAVGGKVMRGKSAPTPERDSIQTLVSRNAAANGASRRFTIPGYDPSDLTRLERLYGYCQTGSGRCFAQGRKGLVHQPEESV
jgi:uncharacterized protein (TIGR02246 family)